MGNHKVEYGIKVEREKIAVIPIADHYHGAVDLDKVLKDFDALLYEDLECPETIIFTKTDTIRESPNDLIRKALKVNSTKPINWEDRPEDSYDADNDEDWIVEKYESSMTQ